jgi:hypothetical protein
VIYLEQSAFHVSNPPPKLQAVGPSSVTEPGQHLFLPLWRGSRRGVSRDLLLQVGGKIFFLFVSLFLSFCLLSLFWSLFLSLSLPKTKRDKNLLAKNIDANRRVTTGRNTRVNQSAPSRQRPPPPQQQNKRQQQQQQRKTLFLFAAPSIGKSSSRVVGLLPLLLCCFLESRATAEAALPPRPQQLQAAQQQQQLSTQRRTRGEGSLA